MKYKCDPDLDFLAHLSSKELEVLVTVLTKNAEGAGRFSELLTEQERYKEHHPKHRKYWDLIAAEFQAAGSHTLGRTIGRIKSYRQILYDVCDRLKVNYRKGSGIEAIENCLLQKTATYFLEKIERDGLTLEDREQLVKELGIKTTDFTAQGVTAALQLLISAGGGALMARFTGPYGLVLWTIAILGGPAYRVTGPATVLIAYLRRIHKHRSRQHKR